MTPRRAVGAVPAAAALAGALVAGCASNATNSGGSSTVPTTTPAPASSTPVTTEPASSAPGSGGGRTMSAPHIACYQNPFTVHYDGTQPHPVELCIQAGTAGRIMITEPTGATWPLPIANPARVVAAHAIRSGQTLVVNVTAEQHGVATLAVPGTSWLLQIAVP